MGRSPSSKSDSDFVRTTPKKSSNNTKKPSSSNTKKPSCSNTKKLSCSNTRTITADQGAEAIKTKVSKKTKLQIGDVVAAKAPNYRCSLNPIYAWISTHKSLITKRHVKVLDRTPFKKFFRLVYDGKLLLENTMKRSQAVAVILNAYKHEEISFMIGEEKMNPKPEDIALIFGLPRMGKGFYPLETQNKVDRDCEFMARYFPEKTRDMKKKQVERAMQLCLTEYPNDYSGFAKLWILHCFATFFFVNGSESLAWGFYYHMRELDHLLEVSWPATILNHLVMHVTGLKNTQSCAGCLHILLYWLAEHTKLVEPEQGYNSTLPRIAKWSIPRICELIEKTNLVVYPKSDVTLTIEASTEEEFKLLNEDPSSRPIQTSVGDSEESVEVEQDADRDGEINSLAADIQSLEAIIEKKDVEIKELKVQLSTLREENNNLKCMLDKEEHKQQENVGIQEDHMLAEEIERVVYSAGNVTGGKSKKSNIGSSIMDAENKGLKVESKRKRKKSMGNNKCQIVEDKEKNASEHDVQAKSKRKRKEPTHMNENVIFLDVAVESSMKTKVEISSSQETTKLKSLSKRGFQKRLSQACILFFSLERPETNAWTNESGFITISGKMLEDLVFKSSINGTILDFYQTYLQRDTANEAIQKSVFIPTNAWTVKRNESYYLVDALLEKYSFRNGEVKWVFAPVHSKNHWTLLVLDFDAPEWYHYNSILGRRKTNPSCSPGAADARKLKYYLEGKINQIRLAQKLPALSNPEGKGTYINYSTTCAHQGHTTVDCGLFVCKYTKDLVINDDVSSSYTNADIDDTRVEIANAVFSDPPRSWHLSLEVLDTPNKKKEVMPDIFGVEDLDVPSNSDFNNGNSIEEVMQSTIREMHVVPTERRLRSRNIGHNDLLALSNDGPNFKIGLSQM